MAKHKQDEEQDLLEQSKRLRSRQAKQKETEAETVDDALPKWMEEDDSIKNSMKSIYNTVNRSAIVNGTFAGQIWWGIPETEVRKEMVCIS